MAVTHYLGREINTGSQIIWGPSGASGVTHNMDLNNLTTGNGREGVYADLGANWEGMYTILFVMEHGGTLPSYGGCYPLWLFCSPDTSSWPTPLTATDAAVTSNNNYRQRWGMFDHFTQSTADTNTAYKSYLKLWKPTGRYVTPLVENWTGSSARSNGTSVLSRITLTRVRGVIYT